MTKRKIKIVKRDAPVQEPTPVPETSVETEKEMTNTVKNWITERRENSEAEKDSNNRKVFNWNSLPDTSEKPA